MIRRLSRRLAYANPWIRIHEDEVELGNGSRSVYGVVEKPDFAVVVPYRDGELVLVEQDRYVTGERLLEFPQGAKFDDPEPFDAEAVARAELREETGYTAGRLIPVGRFYQAVGYATNAANVFLALDLVPGRAEREPQEQGMEVLHLPVAEVHARILDGRIREGCTIAAWGMIALNPEFRALVGLS